MGKRAGELKNTEPLLESEPITGHETRMIYEEPSEEDRIIPILSEAVPALQEAQVEHAREATADVIVEAANSEETDDVEALRAQIEETRTEMTRTVDAIKEKLDPQRIKEEVREATIGQVEEAWHTTTEIVKEKSQEAKESAKVLGRKAVAAARRNPGAVVVVSAVVSWLLLRLWDGRRNRRTHC